MSPIPSPTKARWGDDVDDSDDDDAYGNDRDYRGDQGGLLSTDAKSGGGLVIPPTHKSRIDSNGIQIVTSYRQNPANRNQLVKTVTKLRVETVKVREPKAVAERRRTLRKFGTALEDERTGNKTTVRSKDEIFLEDPNADVDLQDEDPAGEFLFGNCFLFCFFVSRFALPPPSAFVPGQANTLTDACCLPPFLPFNT